MGTEVTLEQLAGYCAELGLMQEVDADRGWVNAALVTHQGLYWLTLRPDVPREVLLLRVRLLPNVPPERRLPMAQALGHLNYSVLLGRFALDLTDGEVLFDTPIPYRGMGVSLGQVAQSLTAMVWTVNKYGPALQRIYWGEAQVEEVLGLPLPGPSEALTRALQRAEEPQPASEDQGSDSPRP